MSASASTFKVMTFNLRKDSRLDRANRWGYRKYMVSDFIRQSGAAVVGVQELMPSMKQDMLRCLEEYRLFGRGRSRRLFNEHSDILVKHDNLEAKFVKTIWLSKHPEKFGSHAFLAFFPRICTICEVTFRDSGRQVRVFNAHFDHISGFARKTGLDMILRYMDQLQQEKPMPMVLMGDFNVRPSNKLISRLRGNLHQYSNIRLVDAYAYANGQAERLNTYHGFKGNHFGKARLDYIFVTDDLEVVNTYVDHTVKDGKYLSDHYPIVATLQFKES